MAEYIEREAAIDALTERNLVVHMDSVNDGLVASCHRSAQRIIANIPAADVRPVVLCRDCSHSVKGKKSLECEKHRYVWNNLNRWVNDDDFCAWGVKREEG